jgi:5'-methylthioadenosine phosphorylase
VKIGLIGGSGFYHIDGFHHIEVKRISTPYGDTSDEFRVAQLHNCTIYFLPRHGACHNIVPHKINFKANLWGFKELDVETIISIGAVGGIVRELKPGTIVVPNQIIDFTRARSSSFFEDSEVVHIDFTEPYCEETRQFIFKAGNLSHIDLHRKGTYVATEGPRLETAAEIRALKILGGDIVGMTGMPEAALARELGICFAAVTIVTNYAAGISGRKLTTTEVMEVMKTSTDKIKALLKETFTLLPSQKTCECKDSLKNAKIG